MNLYKYKLYIYTVHIYYTYIPWILYYKYILVLLSRRAAAALAMSFRATPRAFRIFLHLFSKAPV